MKHHINVENTLPLIEKLLKALPAENVTYCHWKSNNALEYSANGENDLDLLVKRSDGNKFLEILHRLGFKHAIPSLDKRLPGVLDYYGYDFDAEKFVHVHVHFQLILGHDATKNYCLPVERIYLESLSEQQGFKVPSHELEFILLIIRLILKHSTWDTMLIFHGNLLKSEKKELAYLKDRVELTVVKNLLQKQFPFIEEKLFMQCLEALELRRSFLFRLEVGRKVQKALYPYSRRSPMSDVALKIWRRMELGIRRKIFRQKRENPRLSNGGGIIAIVGGDGAGKSTAVDGVYDWLSKEFDVVRVHLGKPRRSMLTRLIQFIRKGSRALITFLKKGPSRKDKSIPQTANVVTKKTEYARMMWDVSVGRDRYKTFAKAKRFSMNGGIVVCDRFPLPEVIKLMDAPQVEMIVESQRMNRFTRFLAQLEKRWYRPILPPELIIVLKLDPQIAVKRKTDEESSYVQIRSTEVWMADFQNTPVIVIDASLSKEEVLSKIKVLVWSNI